MSKIGKINISIPEKVKVSLDGNNLKMEGPLGKNNLSLDMNIFDLNINDGKEVSIKPGSTPSGRGELTSPNVPGR